LTARPGRRQNQGCRLTGGANVGETAVTTPAELQQAVLNRLVAAAVADDRVKACWTEAGRAAGCFPPFAGAIDLHLATNDPLFDALAAGHADFLAAGGRVMSHRDADAPVFARACEAELEGGLKVGLTIERLSLVPKRPRAHVAMLVDKIGQVRYVMDFSGRT
jgi:hypothetical protein